ncbi:hypothetical protein [Micromonospora inositola]|uniref:Knr4/Smi1-like domain-containing protein n=1 Tax=Micromonospora inositola TaxID=47865 RepID=A0A1C5J8B9_9ACTN|nr:hypothetical protein [Micromonospora inositola]SCG66854.1 hypothetical protein GA0070613_4215 [Micromonospora inositola]
MVRMWNAEAYALLDGEVTVDPSAAARLDAWQRRWDVTLPAAVREWFAVGGPGRIMQDNDLAGVDWLALLDDTGPGARLLHLEDDSQGCCTWVVPLDAGDDPPVLLLAPDDATGESGRVYAERFTVYTLARAWETRLFEALDRSGDGFDLDHPLPSGALDRLAGRLTALPVTHGWAGNQGCDALYRFDGPAMVGLAVAGDVVLWSAVASDDRALRDELRALVGAG